MNPIVSHRLHWHDWGRSVVLHGALVAALAWGMVNSPAPVSPSTRLDMAIQWEAEQPPEPAVQPPPPTPAPPEVKPRSPAPAQPAPQPPAPPVTPAIQPYPDAVATAADTVIPAAPVAAVSAELPRAAPPAVVAPAPPSANALAAQQARWEGLLEAALLKHKQYPMVARRMGQAGLVTVEAHFSAQGELLDCFVASGSGFKALDEAALQLVRQAANLVRATHQPGRVAQLRIPIAYEFKES
ncbi:MAG: energy transducer TonB [Gammaproteobacteria bacterium]|nr:energy transducer TonB [Gammaproteobacteria bacterium]MBU4283344.1 energy transducer TonB [Gammaproteobacteria bacterium]MBU4322718.1 energy transducer TonB [Gammaproteobacteria bacterium]MBU4508629.1 energy transducer TonB [Gammaproteobacteria bacterium]